ncbi:Hypp5145 [Branchiostoma lanceolatum]|uniref:Hypp5145 protein n=1 Tax=Branchiostoma lanceolatum TaxID=7740 RepID=A0A8K0AF09_BRALA|nr:Hypp5145 [Branchiostoma lanceolatum]
MCGLKQQRLRFLRDEGSASAHYSVVRGIKGPLRSRPRAIGPSPKVEELAGCFVCSRRGPNQHVARAGHCGSALV